MNTLRYRIVNRSTSKFARVLAATSFLAACSTTVEMPEIPVTHPAHVDASEATMPGPRSIFAVDPDVVAKPGLPVHDRQAHDEHMQGQAGPDDSVHTHVHESYASTARTHPNPEDPPMPGEPGVVFGCQIHPDVTAEMKGQCPQCGLPLLPKVPAMPMSMMMDEHLEPHMDPLNVGDVAPTVIDEPVVVELDEHPSAKKDMEPNSVQHEHAQHELMPSESTSSAPSAEVFPAAMTYACPHHPEVRASFAGATCPKCGMELMAVEGVQE